MANSNVISAFPSRSHNHARCIKTALSSADRLCEERGVRLTALRRRVLELVWSSHTPAAAYDLLGQLRQDKANAAPPTVYRALEFLLEHGLIHRIESLNAYVGCGAPEQHHSGQFLICTACGTSAELDCEEISELVATRASELGFATAGQTIEITGLCAACTEQSP